MTLDDGSWVLVRASSNKPELVVVVESTRSQDDMRALFRGEVKPRYERDALAEDAFWGRVDLAVERANELVRRIRAGDVKHDPLGGACPTWCVRRNAGICRVTG